GISDIPRPNPARTEPCSSCRGRQVLRQRPIGWDLTEADRHRAKSWFPPRIRTRVRAGFLPQRPSASAFRWPETKEASPAHPAPDMPLINLVTSNPRSQRAEVTFGVGSRSWTPDAFRLAVKADSWEETTSSSPISVRLLKMVWPGNSSTLSACKFRPVIEN